MRRPFISAPSATPGLQTQTLRMRNRLRDTRFSVIYLCGLLFSFPVLNADAGNAKAAGAHEDGDYVSALQAYTQTAHWGDAPSQFQLGLMYQQGQGLAVDTLTAFAWYAVAAESNYPPAKPAAVKLFRAFTAVQRIRAKRRAKDFIANFGRQALQEKLHPLLRPADNALQPPALDQPVQPAYPMRALMNGTSGEAIIEFNIATDGTAREARLLHSEPDGVFSQTALEAATKLRYKAPPATVKLQGYHSHRIRFSFDFAGTTAEIDVANQNRSAAINSLASAALDGNATAQYQYALALDTLPYAVVDNRPGKHANALQITALASQAAIQGNSAAQHLLATRLLTGRGCEKDVSKAIKWLTHAAHQGHLQAQYLLAKTSQTHATAGDEGKTSRHWMTKAASAGHSFARRHLANELLGDSGQNPALILELLQPLARTLPEDPETQRLLSLVHHRMHNPEQAHKHWLKARRLASERGWDTSLWAQALARR